MKDDWYINNLAKITICVVMYGQEVCQMTTSQFVRHHIMSKQINTKNSYLPFHNQTLWPSYSFPNNILNWEQSAWEYQTDPMKIKKI